MHLCQLCGAVAATFTEAVFVQGSAEFILHLILQGAKGPELAARLATPPDLGTHDRDAGAAGSGIIVAEPVADLHFAPLRSRSLAHPWPSSDWRTVLAHAHTEARMHTGPEALPWEPDISGSSMLSYQTCRLTPLQSAGRQRMRRPACRAAQA